jgi:hypothetical protein
MRRRRPEQALQKAVMSFLDVALPTDAYAFAVPNGGARSPVEASIFKGQGVKAGVPDIAIIHRGRYIGIELKASAGKLSDAQETMHTRLVLAGAVVATCRSLDEVAGFLGMIVPLRASLR